MINLLMFARKDHPIRDFMRVYTAAWLRDVFMPWAETIA